MIYMNSKKTYLVQLKDSYKAGQIVEAHSDNSAIKEFLKASSMYLDDFDKEIIVSEVNYKSNYKIDYNMEIKKI